ncbi:MAG: methyltransferase domain-containing protein [Deltaproteobacteria bacterium]
MPPLATRRLGVELLDDPSGNPAAVETSLHNIARANRWFGGTAAVCWGLGLALRGVPSGARLSLLDVGSGLGDVPQAAAAWAARRGIRLAPVGLERHPVAARLAAAQGLPTIVGCASAPPVSDKCVDIVSVCMVAHHFEPDSVVELLRACDQLARRAVVVADLRRAAAAALAFRCGARLLRFDPVTRGDGITSIRRGFTVAELTALLARAGVAASVARRPGWRLVATWTPRP